MSRGTKILIKILGTGSKCSILNLKNINKFKINKMIIIIKINSLIITLMIKITNFKAKFSKTSSNNKNKTLIN